MTAVTTLDDAAPQASVTDTVGKPIDAAQLIRHNEDLSGERVNLTIHFDPGMGDVGKHAQFVGLNGVGYNIPRNKVVNVPVEVLHNLQNAQFTQYGRDDNGRPSVSDVPRFAISWSPAAPVGKAAKKIEAQKVAAGAAATKK